jgi:hypothetical protein
MGDLLPCRAFCHRLPDLRTRACCIHQRASEAELRGRVEFWREMYRCRSVNYVCQDRDVQALYLLVFGVERLEL